MANTVQCKTIFDTWILTYPFGISDFLRVLHGFAAKFAAYKNIKVFPADLRGAAVCENNHSLPSSISFCSTRAFKGTVT
jgi:hypothetical protein